MPQGTVILGALILGWIMYLAVNQKIGAYLNLFVGSAGSSPASDTTAPASDTTAAPAPGTIGADPNFQPSVLKPGSFFDTRQPLNPPT
jgi:hypothetical protein